MGFDSKQHWEGVYSAGSARQTSWHQDIPRISLSMIANTGLGHDAAVIDVGGGASLLVDHLLELGFRDLTVLDISRSALDQAREYLQGRASRVDWIEADVTQFQPHRHFDLWHDRAAFHFLTGARDRRRYVGALENSVTPGGHVIIAAFAPSGPEKCSGLGVPPGQEAGVQFLPVSENRPLNLAAGNTVV
jgi:SAM-dependent methyltransferase